MYVEGRHIREYQSSCLLKEKVGRCQSFEIVSQKNLVKLVTWVSTWRWNNSALQKTAGRTTEEPINIEKWKVHSLSATSLTQAPSVEAIPVC